MLFGPDLNPLRGRGEWLLASSCSQTAGPFLSESQEHRHHPRVCRRRENAMQVHSTAQQCKAVQCNAEPISAAQGKALQGRTGQGTTRHDTTGHGMARHGTARQTRLAGRFPRREGSRLSPRCPTAATGRCLPASNRVTARLHNPPRPHVTREPRPRMQMKPGGGGQ